MKRVSAALGSALFLVVAPGTLAGYVPWWISRWRMEPPFFATPATRAVGLLLIVLGIPVLLESFARFATEGLGTPAPVAPPCRLVVRGFYRYVRNPMYVAVCSLILGQALMLGNLRLVRYSAIVWVSFHLWVLVYEEPTLRTTFGAEYEAFCARVPRWIPRFTPWNGGAPG